MKWSRSGRESNAIPDSSVRLYSTAITNLTRLRRAMSACAPRPLYACRKRCAGRWRPRDVRVAASPVATRPRNEGRNKLRFVPRLNLTRIPEPVRALKIESAALLGSASRMPPPPSATVSRSGRADEKNGPKMRRPIGSGERLDPGERPWSRPLLRIRTAASAIS